MRGYQQALYLTVGPGAMAGKNDNQSKSHSKSVVGPPVEPVSLTVDQVLFQLHHILQVGKVFIKFPLILASVTCLPIYLLPYICSLL